METDKTKSYPIRMQETVMDRLRESAKLANLKQGDFINNLLVIYDQRLRRAYEIAVIDFENRCEDLDKEFLKILITDGTDSSKKIQEIGDAFKHQLAEKYKKFFGENK